MSLVDKHPDQDPDRDGAQGADASRTRVGGASPIVRKRPSELLRERRQRIRRRRLTTAGVVLALALAAFYVWGPFHSPHKPEPRSQGYTGTRTDTGRPSPDWANGADIAWQLEGRVPLADEAAIVKNGDQVVLFHEWDGRKNIGVVSLDVSGTQPVTQWRGVLPKDASLRPVIHPVLIGDDVFAGAFRLDFATGSRALAPWAERDQEANRPPATAITSGYGVVIACSEDTCSGWAKDGDQWTMKWERDSAPTPLREYEYCSECGGGTWVPLNDRDVVEWGRATDPFTEWGTSSIVVQYPKRIINTETGEVRSLCLDEAKADQFEMYSTADGWVVADSKTDQATMFAPDGRPLESFLIVDSAGAGDHKAALPITGQAPTSAQLRDFLTTGEAPWAEGILRVLPTTEDNGTKTCGELSFTPTGSTHPTRKTAIGTSGIAGPGKRDCAIRARRPAISEDHSALFLRGDAYGGDDGHDAIVDMHGTSLFHTSGTTYPAAGDALLDGGRSVRVYDDLVLVFSYEGITAFTPRGS